MPNATLTPVAIVRGAAMELENNIVTTKYVNREYSSEFAVEGNKIGDYVNVRKPARFTVRSGANLSVQDFVETRVPIQLTSQKGVDVAFTSKELTLNIEDFTERVLRPRMVQLANEVDYDGQSMMKNSTYQIVGTPGSIPASMFPYLTAGAYIDQMAGPRDGKRAAILSPMGQATLVDGQKGLFQSSDKIADQYDKGTMGLAGGLKFSMDQNVNTHTSGPLGGTPAVNGDQSASAPSGTVADTTSNLLTPFSLATDGWTASAAARLKKGDVFTIQGVYAVNPKNRQNVGRLQQFVVTEDVSSDGSGNATIPILPRPIFSGAYQNVYSATNNIANNALIYPFYSTASTVATNGIVFHENAFCFASADLVMPRGVHMAARQEYKGMSVRFVEQYRIGTDDIASRIDMLYGWAPFYPEHAVRVTE